MDHELVRAEMEKFNRGEPLPTIDISIVKQLWQARKRMAEAGFKVEPGTALGEGAWAGFGFEVENLSPEQFVAQMMRGHLLNALIGRGVLNDYLQSEQSIDKVIAATATLPCNKEDVGEAMVLLHLSVSPPEVAIETKRKLKAEGFDPDHPTIDSKFVQWMKEHC